MSAQVIEAVSKASNAGAVGMVRDAGRCPLGDGSKEKGIMERHKSTTGRGAAGRVIRRLVTVLMCGMLVVAAAGQAWAQYGSGTHGAFPPAPTAGGIPSNYAYLVWNIRTGHVSYCTTYTTGTGLDVCDAGSPVNVEAQIPNIPPGGLTTGVYEFTSFAIAGENGLHRYIVPVGGSPNTPLSILSQGDITLTGAPGTGHSTFFYLRGAHGRTPASGAQNLSVAGGLGGPGGFNGGSSGNGSTTPSHGSPGFGPAGGTAGQTSTSSAATMEGASALASVLNPSLSPLTGASGGGGGAGTGATAPSGCQAAPNGYAGGSGGGGGGGLLLAAANRVTLGTLSTIQAYGGNGAQSVTGCGFGGGGGGGNVRVVSNLIEGTGQIEVSGGIRGNGGAPAGAGGFVRFESNANTYSGSITGSAGGSFVQFPTAPLPANQPQLRITSIGGSSAPVAPTASLGSPDITFASAIDSPVTLTVEASNVPTGTTVNIRVTPAVGAPTTATTLPLAGSLASSSADASVVLPPGAGIVTATATFNVVAAGQQVLNGPRFDGELAQRMEVVTQSDGTSKTFLIARSGARFEVGGRQ